MPVVDHDVHEKVRIGEGWKYRCWNQPRPVLGQDVTSTFSGETWPYIFSSECRFDMSLKDSGCEGCQWRGSGEKYDTMVRENGK